MTENYWLERKESYQTKIIQNGPNSIEVWPFSVQLDQANMMYFHECISQYDIFQGVYKPVCVLLCEGIDGISLPYLIEGIIS